MFALMIMSACCIFTFAIFAGVVGFVLRPRDEFGDPMQDHFGDVPKVK